MPHWLAVILTALVAALPLTGLIALALDWTRTGWDWFGDGFLILYLQVAGLGLLIHLILLLAFGGGKEAEARRTPESDATPEFAPAPEKGDVAFFLQRLPPHVRGDLICLEMQDHYVRAETALGSALILMRFRDAVAELGDAGMQVHRGWWAALDAMEELEREGRGVRLRLRGGRTLPVSRAGLPAVRERVRLRFDSGAPDFKSAGEAARSARGTVPGAVP